MINSSMVGMWRPINAPRRPSLVLERLGHWQVGYSSLAAVRPLTSVWVTSLATMAIFFALSGPLFGQTMDPSVVSKRDRGDFESKAISLADLPPPPPEIDSLLDHAAVTWQYGPVDDPRQIAEGNPMAAETQYRIKFRFRTRLRWRTRGDRITARLRHLSLDWQPSHVVWFRDMPATDDFWTNRLVRHELDHVRISSDRSIEQTYRDRAEALDPFEGRIMPSERPGDAARRIVNDQLQALFEDVSSLAKIRYQELDRQTRHGLDPVPNDSTLRQILNSPLDASSVNRMRRR